jgi:hypothetical protein
VTTQEAVKLAWICKSETVSSGFCGLMLMTTLSLQILSLHAQIKLYKDLVYSIVTRKGLRDEQQWVPGLMIGLIGTSLQLQLIITAHTLNSFLTTLMNLSLISDSSLFLL